MNSRLDETWAICVGIESYSAGPRLNVNGPAKDARRLAAWLTLRGVPENNIKLFVSPLDQSNLPNERPATREIFNMLCNELPADGKTLFLYWAGHGAAGYDGSRRLYYSDATDNAPISIDVNDMLRYLRSEHGHFVSQFCFIDACASSINYKNGPQLTPDLLPSGTPFTRDDQWVFFSTRVGQLAKNLDEQQTGLFSREMREVLEQTPETMWPPDASTIASQLTKRVTQLQEKGKTSQQFSWFWVRSGGGKEEAHIPDQRLVRESREEFAPTGVFRLPARATVRINSAQGAFLGLGLAIPTATSVVHVLTCHNVVVSRSDVMFIDFVSDAHKTIATFKAEYDEDLSSEELNTAVLTFNCQITVPIIPPTIDPKLKWHRNISVRAILKPAAHTPQVFKSHIDGDAAVRFESVFRGTEAWALRGPIPANIDIDGSPIVNENGSVVGIAFTAKDRGDTRAFVIPIGKWRVPEPDAFAPPRLRQSPHIDFQTLTRGRGACCVELAGDFSVVVTGKVLLASAGTYVHVAVDYADTGTTTFALYAPNVDANGRTTWIKDDDQSKTFTRLFAPLFAAGSANSPRLDYSRQCLTKRFGYLVGPYRVTVIFEAPIAVGILEESAFAIAFARALIKLETPGSIQLNDKDNEAASEAVLKETSEPISEEKALAGLLLSYWHSHMSWATIIGSSRRASSPELLWFDRSAKLPDEANSATDWSSVPGVDLFELYKDAKLLNKESEALFKSNVLVEKPFWRVGKVSLPGGTISIWIDEAPAHRPRLCHVGEINDAKAAQTLGALTGAFDTVAIQLHKVAQSDDGTARNPIGALMQIHQLLLELGEGLVLSEVKSVLKAINRFDDVIGAKLASARRCGAIVIFSHGPLQPQTGERLRTVSSAQLKPLKEVMRNFSDSFQWLGCPFYAGTQRYTGTDPSPFEEQRRPLQ